MIACPLPLRVVEREVIVPGTGDDENNAAGLPVTLAGRPGYSVIPSPAPMPARSSTA
jgi:hypothetical protein